MCTKTLIAQLEQTKILSVEEFKMIFDMLEETGSDIKRIQELMIRIMRGTN